jgi:hypothetical protein
MNKNRSPRPLSCREDELTAAWLDDLGSYLRLREPGYSYSRPPRASAGGRPAEAQLIDGGRDES